MSVGRQRDRESLPACSQPSNEEHHTGQSARALRDPVLRAATGTDPCQSPALASREGRLPAPAGEQKRDGQEEGLGPSRCTEDT